ncbi:MAG TPA: hypothetical protein VHM91_24075, partial [Verrucomicrobiales bacterium]|nr:hypothetical protein [Verrucomicrobiales bacterium]
HDRAAHKRRAARVFIKPVKKPEDPSKFLQRAQSGDITPEIASAALLIQNLLVASTGEIAASPLTYAMQLRNLEAPKLPAEARFVEYELSRRAILKNPAGGGLLNTGGLPGYLSDAGNDYSFASPVGGSPLAVPHAAKCISCHGPAPGRFFTFAGAGSPNAPAIRLLRTTENEHAQAVAKEKAKQESFRKLREDWQ